MQKLIKIKPTKLGKIKEKVQRVNYIIKDLKIINDEYHELSDVKKVKLDQKFKPINLKLETTY